MIRGEIRWSLGRRLLLGLLFLWIGSCEFVHDIEITHYVPEQAYHGVTVVTSVEDPKELFCVDMLGQLLWVYQDSVCNVFWDFEVLAEGDILFACNRGNKAGILRAPDTVLWEGTLPGVHHSVVMLPWGNIMYLSARWIYEEPWVEPVLTDSILEVVQETGEVVWSWNLEDYFSPTDYSCPICIEFITTAGARDWSHSNSIHFYEADSAILLNVRNLNTFLMISYPSGDILWACGDAGTFGGGLFSHAHDVELLANGNVLLFDNDLHGEEPMLTRALELTVDPGTQTAGIAWEWSDETMWAPIRGDANRLPNGNTLVTVSHEGRVVEVNPSGEKVWEMVLKYPWPGTHGTFHKAERIPR
ncbi:MAG: aryl-sulfate sulfotransferase [bacterium]